MCSKKPFMLLQKIVCVRRLEYWRGLLSQDWYGFERLGIALRPIDFDTFHDNWRRWNRADWNVTPGRGIYALTVKPSQDLPMGACHIFSSL